MKQWISPPLNILLGLIGILFLVLLAWKLEYIQALSADKSQYKEMIVPMSSMETLAIPPLRNYKMMLDTPLFWESRQRIVAVEQTVVAAPEKQLDKKLPPGRLIGIIDTGALLMAVFKHENKSHYLHVDDQWGAWKVSEIHNSSIKLSLKDETKTLELVSDYVAPAANKNQQLAQKPTVNRSNKGLTESRRAKLPAAVKNLPHIASTEKQVPPLALPAEMTIKEALQTRQRLMAARWQKKK